MKKIVAFQNVSAKNGKLFIIKEAVIFQLQITFISRKVFCYVVRIIVSFEYAVTSCTY